MVHLTRQEQLVLATLVALLLVGWAVKSWRVAHSPAPVAGAAAQR
jgi:predicted metal-binding membrane protein